MQNLTSIVHYFESEMYKFNGQLDSLTWKIKLFEENADDSDSVNVCELVESLPKMKKQLGDLEKQLDELQNLKIETFYVIKELIQQIKQQENILRDKID